MTIGEQIRTIRKKQGLTQKELADKCRMADSAIRKYEADIVVPKLDKLQLLGDALDVPITDFLDLPQDQKKAYRFGYRILQYISMRRELSEQTDTSLTLFRDEIIDWATALITDILTGFGDEAVNNSPIDRELQADKDQMLTLFLRLNTAGRKKAVDAVEQLCMVPSYQSRTTGVYIALSPEQQAELTQALEELKKNRIELELMQQSSHPASASALSSCNSMITQALDAIKQILADAYESNQST